MYARLGRRAPTQVTTADIDFVRTGSNEEPERAREGNISPENSLGGGLTHGRIPSFASGTSTDRFLGDSRHGPAFGGVSGGGADSAAEKAGEKEKTALPGHLRAWFSLPGDGVVDSYLLLMYLRKVLCADGLMNVLRCATDKQPPKQQQQQPVQVQAQSLQTKAVGNVAPPPEIDVSLNRGHRRRSTTSSTETLANSFGVVGGTPGASSVGGGRRKLLEAASTPMVEVGVSSRSVTPPPLTSSLTMGDAEEIEKLALGLSRGVSSDAVLSSSLGRANSDGMLPPGLGFAAASAPANASPFRKGSRGPGRGFLRPDWGKRASFGGGVASTLRHASSTGDELAAHSPTLSDGVRGRRRGFGEGNSAVGAAAAQGAIALVGMGEHPHRDDGRDGGDNPRATAMAGAIKANEASDCEDEESGAPLVSRMAKRDSWTDPAGSDMNPDSTPVDERSPQASREREGEAPEEGFSAEAQIRGGRRGGGREQNVSGVLQLGEESVENVAVDPADLTFFYSSFHHTKRHRSDTIARRTAAASSKVGRNEPHPVIFGACCLSSLFVRSSRTGPTIISANQKVGDD